MAQFLAQTFYGAAPHPVRASFEAAAIANPP